MFALRGLAVSLALYLILYGVLSMLVLWGWGLAREAGKRLLATRLADFLFALRGLPVAAAAVVTLAFVVPSFLLLEPRTSAEPVGEIPLALGACCLLLLGAGAFNAVAAYVKTSKTVAGWLAGATVLPARDSVPVFRIRPGVPALTLTGVCIPRVLLSDAAAAVLSPQELATALQHEMAHAHRRDNLKKLLFRFCAFPGMSRLEAAWCEAEEMAADDAAVASVGDALDLASALIKLSRLAPVHPAAALTTALIHNSPASVNARVERLVAWNERRMPRSRRRALGYPQAALLGTLLGVVATYGAILRDMHALTEWLVR